MEHEWDLKLQKMRSQTEMTVQQMQQQLTAQEQEVLWCKTRYKHIANTPTYIW